MIKRLTSPGFIALAVLLAAGLLLVVVRGGVSTTVQADPTVECGNNGYGLHPDTDMNIYAYPPSGGPGKPIYLDFYANYYDEGDAVLFEVLWDWDHDYDSGDIDPPSTQVAEGYFEVDTTYGSSTFTIPTTAPGAYTVTVCYRIPPSENWYWHDITVYVPDTSRVCGDTSLVFEPDSEVDLYGSYYGPAWGEPGDEFSSSVDGIAPYNSPQEIRLLWDTNLPGDTGDLLESGVVPPTTDTSYQYYNFTSVIPLDTTPGTYNVAYCWLDPSDVWHWAEGEILIPEHPGCGDARGNGEPPSFFDDSGILLSTNSGAPGTMFTIDFSEYHGFYILLAEALWDAEDVENGDLGELIGEGQPGDDGIIHATVPNDAPGGTHYLTVCVLDDYKGFRIWEYDVFEFFVDGPTFTDTPTPTPRPSPTPTPTPSPTSTPTPTSTPSPTLPPTIPPTPSPTFPGTPTPTLPGTPTPTGVVRGDTSTPRPTRPSTPVVTATPTATPEPTSSPTPVPVITPKPADQTVENTDMVAAGVGGMRGNGEGAINLTGVTGVVTNAYLYWAGPEGTSASFAAAGDFSAQGFGVNSQILFNNLLVQGTDLGASSDNCWGYEESHAYKADVTALVNGNGTYTVSNLSGFAEINGASLIVFFNDGILGNNNDVLLFEGNDSNDPNVFDTDGWQALLSGIPYTSGPAGLTLHVSDGQIYDDDALLLNGGVLAPVGPVFNGDTVPADNDSVATYDGGLWDIKTFDIASFLTPGDNTLHLTTGVLDDCFSLIVASMVIPGLTPVPTQFSTSSPPPPTATPAPTPSPTVTLIEPETFTPILPTATPVPTVTPTTAPTASPGPVTPTLVIATLGVDTPTPAPTSAPTQATGDSPTPTAISTARPQNTTPPTVRPASVPGVVTASPTPSRTATATATATATRPASTSPSPSATVAAVTAVPQDNGDQDPGSEIPIENTTNDARPQFAQSVREIGDLSTDADVIMTNLALAGLSLILLLLSAEIFNSTIEANDKEAERLLRKYAGPLVAVVAWIGAVWHSLIDRGAKGPLGAIIPSAIVLLVAGLIYSVEEDGFGFNDKSIVMFISIVLTVAIMTYLYDGGQILVAKRFGIESIIRMFPIGIFVAFLSLAITKIDGFQPGLLYGFIAAAVLVGGREPNKEQDGKIIFFPALIMLGLAFVAFLLIAPFRDIATDNDSILSAIPEAVAVGIFVGVIEGMFLQLIPMKFMDGHKLWSWNKLAWLPLAVITAFLLWHVLLNTGQSSWGAIDSDMAAFAMAAMVVCFLLTMSVYIYFRLRPGPGAAHA